MVVAAAAEETDRLGRPACSGRPAPPCAAVSSISPIAGGRSSGRSSRNSAGIIANSSSIDAAPIASSIARWSSAVLGM